MTADVFPAAPRTADSDVPPAPEEAPPPHFRRDLLFLLLVALATFAFASAVELNEWLSAHTKPLERYQLDEVPVTILMVLIVVINFLWQRGRRLTREYSLRLEAQRALAEQAQENRRLARRNMQVQEDERRTLAHEIHDELGQSLNAIKLDAVAIRQRRWQTPEELDEYTASIIDLTNNLHGSVRALARRLRPVALDELGLGDAIELYLSHWERRNTPIKTCFSTHGDLSSHGEQINITLYRCIQECLTNITRHAGATQVKVNLRQIDRRIELRIEDDGCGMDPLARHVGLGLIGLRERAQALGGSFTLRSRPGTGTCAEMIIPD